MKYILLTGADIGNREQTLAKALEMISGNVGSVIKTSKVYESEPWGFTSDTVFLNQAVLIETELDPESILEVIQEIEIELGRIRTYEQYSSRIIDIDILCGENVSYSSEKLNVPHVRLHEREFALIPLAELASDWIHPVLGSNYASLLGDIQEQPISA